MKMREEDIELLWRYIDKQCNKQEQLQVKQLLNNDMHWKKAYDEIIALNQTLLYTELEQPSMRFTKNVIDAVQTETFAHKTYNSRSLIWIFSLIVATLTLLLVVTGLTGIDWTSEKSLWSLRQIQIDRSQVIFTILAINTILALVLIDILLKRKRTGNG